MWKGFGEINYCLVELKNCGERKEILQWSQRRLTFAGAGKGSGNKGGNVYIYEAKESHGRGNGRQQA